MATRETDKTNGKRRRNNKRKSGAMPRHKARTRRGTVTREASENGGPRYVVRGHNAPLLEVRGGSGLDALPSRSQELVLNTVAAFGDALLSGFRDAAKLSS